MKNSWLITALISGMLSGSITFFLTYSWKLACLAGLLITITVMITNPNRKFMKVFWVLIAMLVVVNKSFFEWIGNFSGIPFKFESLVMGNLITILLALLSFVCLVLDFNENK